ncbi:MAG: DUF1573 domain-containing protein [Deltaproteobacteria bacterium]|nr:MAG: DUF1573 domain-containing protein [Deltaproteobacteria bacterium]
MGRWFSAGAAACVLVLSAVAAWAAPVVSVPRADYDFGTIFQGEKVRHAFTFSNAGNESLVVEKVSSSCGCTAALASAKTLAPGASGEIEATFDSTRFRGAISKTVYLYTNDPAQPVVQLHIKGTVQEELTIEPQQVSFGSVPPKRTVKSTVRLTNRGSREIRLDGLETTTPELTARFSAEVVPPGGKVAVELTLTPKPGQPRFSGYVLFKADGTIRHDLRIPVYADLGEQAAGL